MNMGQFLVSLEGKPKPRPAPTGFPAPAIVGDLKRGEPMPDGPVLPAWAQE